MSYELAVFIADIAIEFSFIVGKVLPDHIATF
jgi:hypothetical protein